MLGPLPEKTSQVRLQGLCVNEPQKQKKKKAASALLWVGPSEPPPLPKAQVRVDHARHSEGDRPQQSDQRAESASLSGGEGVEAPAAASRVIEWPCIMNLPVPSRA